MPITIPRSGGIPLIAAYTPEKIENAWGVILQSYIRANPETMTQLQAKAAGEKEEK